MESLHPVKAWQTAGVFHLQALRDRLHLTGREPAIAARDRGGLTSQAALPDCLRPVPSNRGSPRWCCAQGPTAACCGHDSEGSPGSGVPTQEASGQLWQRLSGWRRCFSGEPCRLSCVSLHLHLPPHHHLKFKVGGQF